LDPLRKYNACRTRKPKQAVDEKRFLWRWDYHESTALSRKDSRRLPFFSLTAIVYLPYRRSSLLMVCNIRSLLFDPHKWKIHSHSTKLALEEFSNGRFE
jgi:hypothetical protein